MIPGIVDSAVAPIRSFTDEFTGTGALNDRWINVRGSWSRLNDKAYSANSASTYPLVVFNANTNALTVRAENGSSEAGWGVAFWVQDADNWWAFVNYRTTGYVCDPGDTLNGTTCTRPDTTSCTTSTSTSCEACGTGANASYPFDNGAGTCYTTGCPSGYYFDSTNTCCSGATPCRAAIGEFNECRGCAAFTITGTSPQVCTTTTTTNCVTVPGETYGATFTTQYRVQLLKSVAGVVTQETAYSVQNTTSTSERFSVMQVSASKAGVLTLYAQMANGTTSSVSSTPASPNRRRRAGMMVAPSYIGTVAAQAQSIERFVYSPV
jgi:hypothetical protein